MERIDLCGGWTFSLPDGPQKQRVRLPHDFSIGTPRTPDSPMGAEGGWFQGGVGVYQRTLTLPPAPRTVLVVEGCMGAAQVRLNGALLAEHPYGYTEFHVDLSGRLTGQDVLTITADHTDLPSSRWYTGSGLYRPVWAAVGGEVSIPLWSAWAAAPLVSSDRAEAEVSFAVENAGRPQAVPISVEITAPDGTCAACLAWEQTLGPGRTEITRRLTLPRPMLWSPDSPALYTAVLTAGADRETAVFGIRTVQLSPERGLVFNGRPLKLRGGCIHHDNGPLGACAHAQAEERKIARLKAAGYNAVRCAHNPPSRALLDACDRLGMLVIDEAFDCWQRGKTSGDYHRWFDQWWRTDLAAMVLRDRSHPSVLMYSIGNEIPERCEPAGAQLAQALCAQVRRLDPTRPVTCGVNGTFVEGGQYQGLLSNLLNGEGVDLDSVPPEVREILRRAQERPQDWGALTQAFLAPLDAAGYNYLDFRYETDRVRFPDRVICGTESFPKLMVPVWRRTLESPNVIGDFTWAAWDYLGESGIGRAYYGQPSSMFAGYPYHLATCGDFDICGAIRPQGRMRRVMWGMDHAPAIFVLPPELAAQPESVTAWGWPAVEESWTFPGREGQAVRVEVYSNADQVQLWLNGVLLGQAAVKDCGAQFRVKYAPGVLRAVNLRGGRPAEAAALETAREPVSIALIPDGGALAVDGDLAFLWAQVQDSGGRRVPWAEYEITCTAAGPARIIASGSGGPERLHCYTHSSCRTDQGRALFVLQREEAPGPVEISASAEGLTCARCSSEDLLRPLGG